jgi:hypothetical protein
MLSAEACQGVSAFNSYSKTENSNHADRSPAFNPANKEIVK